VIARRFSLGLIKLLKKPDEKEPNQLNTVRAGKPEQLNLDQPRYDIIVGDKQVFFAQTLNYAYVDNSEHLFYFRLDYSEHTISIKLRLSPADLKSNQQGLVASIEFYE
jgi:hypothetical protein